jgi:hypothetical protein
VRWERVRLTRDHWLAVGAPKTLGDTVHLRSSWGHFEGAGLDLTDAGLACLVHELVHVWQHQRGGLAYIPGSVLAQLWAILRGEGRGGAYRWQRAQAAGLPWARWNPEQQAQLVEDLHEAHVRIERGAPRPGDAGLAERAAPHLAELRAGRGAPGGP